MSSFPNHRDRQNVPITVVKPYRRHLRHHSKNQIEKLKKLIRQYGQVVPVIVDEENTIIDGCAVWQAMRELDAGEITVVQIANRSSADIKALRLALNRVAQEGKWDDDSLRLELQELLELSFELELTAFDLPEINARLELDQPNHGAQQDADAIPPLQDTSASASGDIWKCGRHRVGCCSAIDDVLVNSVRARKVADVCFTDPPYARIASWESVKRPGFAQAGGEISSGELVTFLAASLEVLRGVCKTDALVYVCVDWQHIYELIGTGRQCHLQLLNICIWTKRNADFGLPYRNQHELICVFKNGSEPNSNSVAFGRHGRNRSNVWTYQELNTFGPEQDSLLTRHPIVKPVSLIADALRDATKRGGVVFDPFLGSGATLMAANETGRVYLGLELDPRYVDVAVRRWQARTGGNAVNATTGELFDERADRCQVGASKGRPHD